MNLKYAKNSEKSCGYNAKTIVKELTESELIRELKQEMRKNTKRLHLEEISLEDYGEHNGYILGTLCDEGWFRKQKHILLMDIDHEDFKDTVKAYLDEKKIAYQVIDSSNSRYWLIVDYIGSFKECSQFAWRIPEIDPQYLRYIDHHKKFVLRGYPRGGNVPNFKESSEAEGSKLFKEYVQAVKEYWEKPHIQWMVEEYLINTI